MKIIKFYKDGCVPCQSVSKFFEENNVEVQSVIPFDNPEMAIKYGVMSVPVTVLVDAEEKEIKRSIGYKDDELEEMLKIYRG